LSSQAKLYFPSPGSCPTEVLSPWRAGKYQASPEKALHKSRAPRADRWNLFPLHCLRHSGPGPFCR